MDASVARFLARAAQVAARCPARFAPILQEHTARLWGMADRARHLTREQLAWFLVALRRIANHGDPYSPAPAYRRHAVAHSPAGTA